MSNESVLSGTAITSIASPDPALCRVSGYLKDVHGKPLSGASIVIRHKYCPIGQVANTLFLKERSAIISNSEGLVVFDLLRKANVFIELPNRMFDHVIPVTVPDQSSIDLVALLFPYIVSIEFDDTSPVALNVGDTHDFTMTANLSNGTTMPVPTGAAVFDLSDDFLAPLSDYLYEAVTPGSMTITITEIDTSKFNILIEADTVTPINLFEVPDPVLPPALTVNIT